PHASRPPHVCVCLARGLVPACVPGGGNARTARRGWWCVQRDSRAPGCRSSPHPRRLRTNDCTRFSTWLHAKGDTLPSGLFAGGTRRTPPEQLPFGERSAHTQRTYLPLRIGMRQLPSNIYDHSL